MTKEECDRKFEVGQQNVVKYSDESPIKWCSNLGRGITIVRLRNAAHSTIICKSIGLPIPTKQRNRALKSIKEEIKSLRTLVHPHVVTLVGTFEERSHHSKHFYCLLMSPVGDNDLFTFLQICSEPDGDPEQKRKWVAWIQDWFACLPSALDYIHGQGIRHQDIKPSNTIHKGGKIFFTDFGSSSRFIPGHTTSTDNFSSFTPMYAAPEINGRYGDPDGRHGRSADIFALGCVYCDMLCVWQGHSLSDYHDYLSTADGKSYSSFRYCERVNMLRPRFEPSTLFPQCIEPMLSTDRGLRPTAAETVTKILSLFPWGDFGCECIPTKRKEDAVHILGMA